MPGRREIMRSGRSARSSLIRVRVRVRAMATARVRARAKVRIRKGSD